MMSAEELKELDNNIEKHGGSAGSPRRGPGGAPCPKHRRSCGNRRIIAPARVSEALFRVERSLRPVRQKTGERQLGVGERVGGDRNLQKSPTISRDNSFAQEVWDISSNGKDPWQEQIHLPLFNAVSNEQMVWSTFTAGGRDAIANLLTAFAERCDLNPEDSKDPADCRARHCESTAKSTLRDWTSSAGLLLQQRRAHPYQHRRRRVRSRLQHGRHRRSLSQTIWRARYLFEGRL